MSAKHKISQSDLRKFMSLYKQKTEGTSKKIESPLAKYLPDGTLKCILCDAVVKSETVWTFHIHSKIHKDNITRKKQGVHSEERLPPDRLQGGPSKESSDLQSDEESSLDPLPVKRPAPSHELPPPKKLKSILKKGSTLSTDSQLPAGFFDSTPADSTKSPVKIYVDPYSVPSTSKIKPEDVEMDVSEPQPSTSAVETDLPEGFFDNPLLDAKARNVEYRDPVEDEWERFQKEMKEEVTLSTQIIQDESEVATVERQIIEVDEQLKNWSRVLDLEKKKETLQTTVSLAHDVKKEDDSSSSSDEDLEEFVSWRTKNSFK